VAVWEPLRARARSEAESPLEARTALVGRERELDVLRDTLTRVRAERTPQLVTLVGVPGIGKSRLLLELSKIADADAGLISWRQGRSLPYGDGVSFWALAEMVKAQAGILESDTSGEAEAKLAEMTADVMPGTPDAGWVGRHLGALVGLGGGNSSAASAVRRWPAKRSMRLSTCCCATSPKGRFPGPPGRASMPMPPAGSSRWAGPRIMPRCSRTTT
jgi:hypothetical protein